MTTTRRVSVLAGAAALLALVAAAPAHAIPAGSSAFGFSSTVERAGKSYFVDRAAGTSGHTPAEYDNHIEVDGDPGGNFGEETLVFERMESHSKHENGVVSATSSVSGLEVIKDNGFGLVSEGISSWIDSDGNIGSSWSGAAFVFGDLRFEIEEGLAANTMLADLDFGDFDASLLEGLDAIFNEQGDGYVNAMRLTFDGFTFGGFSEALYGEVIIAHSELSPIPLPGAIGPMLLALSGFGVAGFRMRRHRKAA